ncbi:MAG: GAF domain-containing protein [Clostridiales bacterium]|jgi:GAF domain-containing protein|nr:GAF domain-containing protein [Clostridiales bacterium]
MKYHTNNTADLLEQAKSLISADKSQVLSNMSNLSSWIYHQFDNINWAGFYLYNGHRLVLATFCGKVACTKIDWDKGVCGNALAHNKTLIVPDVHKYPGHIACDSASNSEIVIPMYNDKNPIGVLDIDSPIHDRFDTNHQHLFEEIVKTLLSSSVEHILQLNRLLV